MKKLTKSDKITKEKQETYGYILKTNKNPLPADADREKIT